jgi:hypothetical protein
MLLANIKPPQIIQQNAINNTLSSLHGHQSIPPNENVHNFDQNCETDQKSQHKSTRLGDDLFGISQSSYELRYESQLDSEHDISLAFYDNNNLDQNSQNSLPKSQKKNKNNSPNRSPTQPTRPNQPTPHRYSQSSRVIDNSGFKADDILFQENNQNDNDQNNNNDHNYDHNGKYPTHNNEQNYFPHNNQQQIRQNSKFDTIFSPIAIEKKKKPEIIQTFVENRFQYDSDISDNGSYILIDPSNVIVEGNYEQFDNYIKYYQNEIDYQSDKNITTVCQFCQIGASRDDCYHMSSDLHKTPQNWEPENIDDSSNGFCHNFAQQQFPNLSINTINNTLNDLLYDLDLKHDIESIKFFSYNVLFHLSCLHQIEGKSDDKNGEKEVIFCPCYPILNFHIKMMRKESFNGTLHDYINGLPSELVCYCGRPECNGNHQEGDLGIDNFSQNENKIGQIIKNDSQNLKNFEKRNNHTTIIFTQTLAKLFLPYLFNPLCFIPSIGILNIHPPVLYDIETDTSPYTLQIFKIQNECEIKNQNNSNFENFQNFEKHLCEDNFYIVNEQEKWDNIIDSLQNREPRRSDGYKHVYCGPHGQITTPKRNNNNNNNNNKLLNNSPRFRSPISNHPSIYQNNHGFLSPIRHSSRSNHDIVSPSKLSVEGNGWDEIDENDPHCDALNSVQEGKNEENNNDIPQNSPPDLTHLSLPNFGSPIQALKKSHTSAFTPINPKEYQRNDSFPENNDIFSEKIVLVLDENQTYNNSITSQTTPDQSTKNPIQRHRHGLLSSASFSCDYSHSEQQNNNKNLLFSSQNVEKLQNDRTEVSYSFGIHIDENDENGENGENDDYDEEFDQSFDFSESRSNLNEFTTKYNEIRETSVNNNARFNFEQNDVNNFGIKSNNFANNFDSKQDFNSNFTTIQKSAPTSSPPLPTNHTIHRVDQQQYISRPVTAISQIQLSSQQNNNRNDQNNPKNHPFGTYLAQNQSFMAPNHPANSSAAYSTHSNTNLPIRLQKTASTAATYQKIPPISPKNGQIDSPYRNNDNDDNDDDQNGLKRNSCARTGQNSPLLFNSTSFSGSINNTTRLNGVNVLAESMSNVYYQGDPDLNQFSHKKILNNQNNPNIDIPVHIETKLPVSPHDDSPPMPSTISLIATIAAVQPSNSSSFTAISLSQFSQQNSENKTEKNNFNHFDNNNNNNNNNTQPLLSPPQIRPPQSKYPTLPLNNANLRRASLISSNSTNTLSNLTNMSNSTDTFISPPMSTPNTPMLGNANLENGINTQPMAGGRSYPVDQRQKNKNLVNNPTQHYDQSCSKPVTPYHPSPNTQNRNNISIPINSTLNSPSSCNPSNLSFSSHVPPTTHTSTNTPYTQRSSGTPSHCPPSNRHSVHYQSDNCSISTAQNQPQSFASLPVGYQNHTKQGNKNEVIGGVSISTGGRDELGRYQGPQLHSPNSDRNLPFTASTLMSPAVSNLPGRSLPFGTSGVNNGGLKHGVLEKSHTTHDLFRDVPITPISSQGVSQRGIDQPRSSIVSAGSHRILYTNGNDDLKRRNEDNHNTNNYYFRENFGQNQPLRLNIDTSPQMTTTSLKTAPNQPTAGVSGPYKSFQREQQHQQQQQTSHFQNNKK